MSIPTAVRKQAEASERLAVEHGLKKGQGTDEPVIVNPVIAEPPAENWENRFKSFKKSTDNTIANLRGQLGASQQQIAESQLQVQELINNARAQPVDKANEGQTGIKDDGFDIESLPADMREKYDEDFLKSMSNLNTIQMTKLVGDLQTRLSSIEGNIKTVETTQAKSVRDIYYDKLDASEPTWESIGEDKAFIEYLTDSVSEFDSRKLSVLLNKADEENDYITVLKIIAAYKKQAATANTTQNGTTTQQNTLAELESPEGGTHTGNAIDAIGAQTEVFTESQVNAFFSDVTKNVYSAEEARAIELKIQAAQMAGNILPG